MAMTWVKVVRSDGAGDGDDLYMDGNFADKAGKIGISLRTETGEHNFVTVDAEFKPQWQKRQIVDKPPGNARDNPVIVRLEPV
jgi:hypothetical protein